MHVLICAYGGVAGILIFLGEREKILAQGPQAGFVNTRTGEVIPYNLKLHARFFLSNQEKAFSIIVLVCIVMANVLTGFLGYHLKLAWNNKTTNEDYKRDDFEHSLKNEKKVLEKLYERSEEWQPSKDDPNEEMNKITIDGREIPRQKEARLKKIKELIKDVEKRYKRLNENTPYKPKKSFCTTISDIWNCR